MEAGDYWQTFQDRILNKLCELERHHLCQVRFTRVLIDRIKDGIDSKLRDEQAGFRRRRSTTEQIFILRNIIEQVVEWQATLYNICGLRKGL